MTSTARASTANGTHNTTTAGGGGEPAKTYYEQQREMLMAEIAQSLEHVLQNVNRLNRSLEEVIQVGNEFAPVESLWSHFEGVMGQREDEGEERGKKGAAEEEEEEEERGDERCGDGVGEMEGK